MPNKVATWAYTINLKQLFLRKPRRGKRSFSSYGIIFSSYEFTLSYRNFVVSPPLHVHKPPDSSPFGRGTSTQNDRILNQSTPIHLNSINLRPSASLTTCALHHTSSLNALGTLAVKSYEPGSPLNFRESLTSSFITSIHQFSSIYYQNSSIQPFYIIIHPFKSSIITLLGPKPAPNFNSEVKLPPRSED